MHLRPHGRVDAVRADEQRAARLGGRAVGVFDERGDTAVGILPIAHHPATKSDRLRPDPLHHFFMQQHVELAAMNRVLRPVVASQKSARLGINVIAVKPD